MPEGRRTSWRQATVRTGHREGTPDPGAHWHSPAPVRCVAEMGCRRYFACPEAGRPARARAVELAPKVCRTPRTATPSVANGRHHVPVPHRAVPERGILRGDDTVGVREPGDQVAEHAQ